MKLIPVVTVDAFTDQPFGGNPAAVCVLRAPAPEPWMRSVAAEMNLSETAFLWPEGEGYHLRWFTPRVEVALCGHATLASAHVLWETGQLRPDESAHFYTRSGQLTCHRDGAWIEMNFPSRSAAEVPPPPGLLDALGLDPHEAEFVGLSQYDYLIQTVSVDVVKQLRPNFSALKSLNIRGIIVTAAGNTPFDFTSRFFAPGAGIDEDPVTGSAHCTLAPFWAPRLGLTTLLAWQASERGGVVGVEVRGDRVILRGQAITMMTAQLHIPPG